MTIAPEMMGLIYANRAGGDGYYQIDGMLKDFRRQENSKAVAYWTRALHSCQRTLLSRR